MNIRISEPEGTLIVSSGTYNPHSGPCYFDLTKLQIRSQRKVVHGEISLRCTSFSGENDPLAEKVIKRIVRYFIRKQSRKGDLSISTETKDSGTQGTYKRKLNCHFNFKPETQWQTAARRRKFIDQVKEAIYKRICGYDR